MQGYKMFCVVLIYSYLFALREGTFVRKRKEKLVFLLLFAHLFVPLQGTRLTKHNFKKEKQNDLERKYGVHGS